MVEASIEHGIFGIELRCLFKKSHLDVATVDDVALITTFPAAQDGEQGGFSRSVFGHQPNLLSFGNAE